MRARLLSGLSVYRDGHVRLERGDHFQFAKIVVVDGNQRHTGFHYFNFAIDGADLAVVSRTAYDTGTGNLPPRAHDSNLMTFHRIQDFRTASPNQILVADTANNQVLRYEITQDENTPLGKFTLGSAFSGTAISRPTDLAQDAKGDVYIREQGGRILRFDALGNFIGTVNSSPVAFQGTQISIKQAAYGEEVLHRGRRNGRP